MYVIGIKEQVINLELKVLFKGGNEIMSSRFSLSDMHTVIEGENEFVHIEEIVDKMNEMDGLIQELYDFRMIYNALLFNEWFKNGKFTVYKSKKHHDGELCFDGEWFVVVAILPTGQITNHYHVDYWDLFKIPSYEYVIHEFDGHTPEDVLDRMCDLIKYSAEDMDGVNDE